MGTFYAFVKSTHKIRLFQSVTSTLLFYQRLLDNHDHIVFPQQPYTTGWHDAVIAYCSSQGNTPHTVVGWIRESGEWRGCLLTHPLVVDEPCDVGGGQGGRRGTVGPDHPAGHLLHRQLGLPTRRLCKTTGMQCKSESLQSVCSCPYFQKSKDWNVLERCGGHARSFHRGIFWQLDCASKFCCLSIFFMNFNECLLQGIWHISICIVLLQF